MRYLVAIPIPEPWRSRLLAVKAGFRPAGWRDTMDPHITVLAPGRPTVEPDQARAAFAALRLSLAPFQVSARRLYRFSRRHRHTIVLAPHDACALTTLFNAVIAQCVWQDTTASTKRAYQPHITLVNQVSDTHLEPMEADLKSFRPEVDFECREIALYAKQARWPAWQELQRLSFPRRS